MVPQDIDIPFRMFGVFRTALLAMLWLSATASMATAQFNPVASDTELGAAYCLGYMTQSLKVIRGADIDGNTRIIADHKISRFRDYLIAKGYLTTDRDPLPILLARKHGTEDVDDCYRQLDQTAAACSRKCAPKCGSGGTSCGDCFETCDKPAACQGGKRCEQVEKALPF